MKIGILTFHWGTNYGGVLQSYALQCYLKSIGHEVEIINYAPLTYRDSFFLCFKSKSIGTIKKNILNYFKERKFRRFRKSNLILSARRYYANTSSEIFNNDYDVIVVGSDQVWNPYIALNYGLPYWLPSKGKARKIAYAVSLGCDNYPLEILEKQIACINDFYAISVREKSAVDIIQPVYKKGVVELMPDPTILLESFAYRKFIQENQTEKSCFIYALQENQKLISVIEQQILKNGYSIFKPTNYIGEISIEEWLSTLYNSELVVTNSFHGVMFSLIFHKSFYVVPIEGVLAGMNDRIYTVLEYLGLNERIINNIENVKNKNHVPIDWHVIEQKMNILRSKGRNFLLSHIEK